MRTVGARELKQNPNSVIQRVLESGEEYEITSHGHRTGAKLVRSDRPKASWVPGSALADLPPMGRENVNDLIEEIDDVRNADEVRDPWDEDA